jgi:acetolactate synthase-1/2/3 large subunit
VVDCDLIMAIGARWDDRITGRVSDFCTNAVKIHVDIDASEFNKIIRPDVAIHGDARLVIEDLIPQVEMADTADWLRRCERWRKKYPLHYPKQGGLRAQHVLDRLDALTRGEAILTTDVGQHQMWAGQFCRARNARHWISSGGAGTMGFGFPAAIGAQFANPDKKVWAIVGDGGFQMTQAELATAQIHKLPVNCLIINNNYLGMIRQWQELFYENRLSGADLEGNPDFVKLARAYGIKGQSRLREAGPGLRHQGPAHPAFRRRGPHPAAGPRVRRGALRGGRGGGEGGQRLPDDPGRGRRQRDDHRASQAQAGEAGGEHLR